MAVMTMDSVYIIYHAILYCVGTTTHAKFLTTRCICGNINISCSRRVGSSWVGSTLELGSWVAHEDCSVMTSKLAKVYIYNICCLSTALSMRGGTLAAMCKMIGGLYKSILLLNGIINYQDTKLR